MKKLPAASIPVSPEVKQLLINVAYTTPNGTLGALREAARLTAGMDANIRVIVPRVVPYPLELNQPQVNPECMAQHFRRLCVKTGADLRFEIVLCREVAHAYSVALDRNSVVIVGGRNRWWPTRETRLARSLTCKGHNVLFVNVEKHSNA